MRGLDSPIVYHLDSVIQNFFTSSNILLQGLNPTLHILEVHVKALIMLAEYDLH